MEGRCRQEVETTFSFSPHLFKMLQGGQLSPPWGSFDMAGLCILPAEGMPHSPGQKSLLQCPDNPKTEMEGAQLRV